MTNQSTIQNFADSVRKTVKISELGEIITGDTPSTKKEENYGGDIPFVRVSDFSDSLYFRDTEKKLTEKGAKEVKKRELPENAVMVSCIGNGLGKTAMTDRPCFTNQQINSVIPNDQYYPWYVYYLLSSIQEKFQQYAGGSAQPILSKTNFGDIEVEVYQNYEKQKRVGDTLRWVDEKIHINSDINKTLEKISQTIYKSWFVNFDPFDDFKESELGRIPTEFEVVKFSEVCETSGGGTPDTDNTEYWEGENNWLTPDEVTSLNTPIVYDTDRKLTDSGLANTSAKLMPERSVLLASRGTGTVGELAINRVPMATNQGFICLNPNENIPSNYLLHVVREKRPEIENVAGGSTFPELSQTAFNTVKFALAPEPKREQFDVLVESFYDKVYQNKKENDTLSDLRDTLLPKLLSGEVDLDD